MKRISTFVCVIKICTHLGTLQNIVLQDIDEETRMVIEYFEEHNIPCHMVNDFAIRDDDTSIDTPKFINITCNRCKKS